MTSKEETSGMAIASLVLGIISLFLGWIPVFGWLIVILAVTFGFLALRSIKEDSSIKGRGLAIAGIILACIPIFFTILLAALTGLFVALL